MEKIKLGRQNVTNYEIRVIRKIPSGDQLSRDLIGHVVPQTQPHAAGDHTNIDVGLSMTLFFLLMKRTFISYKYIKKFDHPCIPSFVKSCNFTNLQSVRSFWIRVWVIHSFQPDDDMISPGYNIFVFRFSVYCLIRIDRPFMSVVLTSSPLLFSLSLS